MANGWYLVSVKMGDAAHAREQMRVKNADGGAILLDNLSTASGEFLEETFVVNVTDMSLDLEFSDTGGFSPGGTDAWLLNALEIHPGRILTIGIPTQTPVTADGVTVDTFTGFEATPLALVTVETTLGTLTSTDDALDIAGVQVTANAMGEFMFSIQRPTR